MIKKKKVAYISDFHGARTGFGRHSREVLKYLAGTGKYEIIEIGCGVAHESPHFIGKPWKIYGTIPPPDVQQVYLKHGQSGRAAMNYGAAVIDDIVNKERMDVLICCNDIWATDSFVNKPWFSTLTPVIHTPVDSLPLLESLKDMCKKTPHVYTMASFAQNALKKEGFDTGIIHNTLNENCFYNLGREAKAKLKKDNNIPEDAFVIGFMFRNQLRKQAPNLLSAFKKLIEDNDKAYLLFHTSFEETEGWDIPKLMRDIGVPNERVLATHYCKKCHRYEIRPYSGPDKECKFCGEKTSVSTVPVGNALTEADLNEIYNCMDCYCHCMSSGGQEMPLQESKLCELPTLCTFYSCGEDWCDPTAEKTGGFPLEWHPYYESGSNFIKASTSFTDIAKKLQMVYEMPLEERERLGKIGREYVISKCSPEVVGKQYEELLDSLPFADWSKVLERNVNYQPAPNLTNYEFATELFTKMAGAPADDTNKDFQEILLALKQGEPREKILEYVRAQVKHHEKKVAPEGEIDLNDYIDKLNPNRIAIVMPESAGDVFMITSLLPSLKRVYPEYDIYFITKPHFFEILIGNPYLKNIIPHHPKFENELYMSGAGPHEGFFEICFFPFIQTQRMLGYLRNGKDRIEFELK